MQQEQKQFKNMWKLVPRQNDHPVIETKWVYQNTRWRDCNHKKTKLD